MEASRTVLVVGVQKHLNGVVLDVGVANHLLGDGLVVRQLFLHLQSKRDQNTIFKYGRQTKMVAVRPVLENKNFGSFFGGGWKKVNRMYFQVLCWLF